MLAGAPSPRAILLISDGYENRDPAVATVLSTWPADLRVFTIALGPAADTALLQQIATQTGGIFQASPTALDLHLIYNQMRADITDDGLILNRAVAAGQDAGEHSAHVEPTADWLTVTVSTADPRPPAIVIRSPSGRAVSPDDFGVQAARGEGYAVVRIARPAPGRWRICTHPMQSACVVAAFVTSPLRITIQLPPRPEPKAELVAKVRASFGDARLAPVHSLFRSRTMPNFVLPKEHGHGGVSCWSDSLPRAALAAMGAMAKLDVVTAWPGGRIMAPPGLSRVEIELEGRLPGGAPFRRVVLRTMHVP
jgi:hypothetical protein